MHTKRISLVAVLFVGLGVCTPAQDTGLKVGTPVKPRLRRTATPTATALPPSTPTPAGIDKAKFEKLYRAGKVFLQAASWGRSSRLESVPSAIREFEAAKKALALERSIARDLASSPAEEELVLAYGDSGMTLASYSIEGDMIAANAFRQLGSELTQEQKEENNRHCEQLQANIQAAEDLYLGRVPTVTPSP